MREIKFRAWSYFGKEFIYTEKLTTSKVGFLFENHAAHVNGNPDQRFSPLQEFTCLLDKTGKEIFESDLVKIFAGTENESIEEVMFDEGCFVVDGFVPLYVHCQGDNHDPENQVPHCEIIGNLYSNPELLKS